jgi:hypothetical protein
MKSDDKIKVNYTRAMDPSTIAIIAIVYAAGSEIIGLLPIRENTWVQLILKVLKVLLPKK